MVCKNADRLFMSLNSFISELSWVKTLFVFLLFDTVLIIDLTKSDVFVISKFVHESSMLHNSSVNEREMKVTLEKSSIILS